jgi:dTDP-glucose pyrophosphorylase
MQMEIDLIVLMAGAGSRLTSLGSPKPLVDLQGKPFFYWSTKSIIEQVDITNLYFVYLEDHQANFQIREQILIYFPFAKFISIYKVLNGPVMSLNKTLLDLKSVNNKIVIDCDQAIGRCDFLADLSDKNFMTTDIYISTIKSDNPAHGYIVKDESNKVMQIEEKKLISDDALGGIYLFSKKLNLEKEIFELVKVTKSEVYMSSLISYLINEGKEVVSFDTPTQISFGTFQEYSDAKLQDVSQYLGFA